MGTGVVYSGKIILEYLKSAWFWKSKSKKDSQTACRKAIRA